MAEITHGDVLQTDFCQESEYLGFLHFISKDFFLGGGDNAKRHMMQTNLDKFGENVYLKRN